MGGRLPQCFCGPLAGLTSEREMRDRILEQLLDDHAHSTARHRLVDADRRRSGVGSRGKGHGVRSVAIAAAPHGVIRSGFVFERQ
jgi:hypothetical protein